jgi:hypothetical protein
MSQSDFQIDNVSRSLFRTENNTALQALASLSSGATEPTTTYAYMLWADTTSGLLKQRNAANSAWISKGLLSATDWGYLAKTGGTLTGLLNQAVGADIASAATVDLTAATGNTVNITGTTTITAFTMNQGQQMTLIMEAATPLTYNATTMNIQGGESYTTTAGDKLYVVKDSDNVIRVDVVKQNGMPVIGNLTAMAAQSTATGSSKDFTGIPSWVKEITINFAGVSTNGTGNILIQIGDSGGIETTGYLSSAWSTSAATGVNGTTGFIVTANVAAATVFHGSITLTLLDATDNTWAASGNIAFSNNASVQVSAGSKALSATLDRLRVLTADTFDSGKINVVYK